MTERYTSPYEGEARKGNKLPDGAPLGAERGEAGKLAGLRVWVKGLGWAGAVVGAFVLGSIPFWIWPLDLALSGAFYSPETGWAHGFKPLWQFLYEFGTLPSVLVVAAALVVLIGSWTNRRWLRYRKVAGYLVLCMVMGPGVLINVCLKSEWGRPRPRQVEQFGGQYPFEPVLTVNPDSPGQSFPCGHCSMGFYLFSVAMLVGWKTRAGMLTGLGATGFGLLIGMARIVQGGHFLSDVWWAAGLCLATSVFLYYGLSLDRSRWYHLPASAARVSRLPVWMLAACGAGMIVLIVAVLLATPYRQQEDHPLALASGRPFRLILQLEGDRHELATGDQLRISSSGSGHGMPGSAIKSELYEKPGQPGEHGEQTDLFLFRQRRSGWFWELDQATRVNVPRDGTGRVELEVRSGELWVSGGVPEAAQEWNIVFPSGNGRVHLPRAWRESRGSLKLTVRGAMQVEEPAPAE